MGFSTYFGSPQYSADEEHTYGEKIIFVRNIKTSYYSDRVVACFDIIKFTALINSLQITS